MPVRLIKDLTAADLPITTDKLVIIGDPTTGTAFKTEISNLPTGVSTLASLTDVNISSPADGQLLQYQTVDNKWHNVSSIFGGTF